MSTEPFADYFASYEQWATTAIREQGVRAMACIRLGLVTLTKSAGLRKARFQATS
jgi:hypothetical protein